MPKLTKKLVDSLEFPTTGQKFIWDTDLKGFGIRLTPSGKTFIAQSRVQGQTKRTTIGKYGVYTVQQARDDAKDTLRDMSRGINPNAEKRRQKTLAVTLKTVADAYIKDRKLKQSSISDIRKHMNGSFKEWSEVPITCITRDKVLSRFRELSKNSKAQTNQAFRILRALINYARAAYRPDDVPILLENPVQILSDAKLWHSIQPKSRRVPTDKVGHVWNLLQSLRTDPIQSSNMQTLADAITFTLITGGRWGEVSCLKWDQINLDDSTWELKDPKNHNPIIFPLSSQAQDILKNRKSVNEYVFNNNKSASGHVYDQRPVMNKIAKFCNEKLSVHDLRRTFRAIAGECDIEFWKTKLLMNHKLSGDITISAYTETNDLRYLSSEVEKIGQWIERQGVIAANNTIINMSQEEAV